ncbi:hypothetical protein CHS0354_003557 [Potamilus streckersoni]|uniref:C1q domain-containing protein n=1 Tax=Potamilus streckersoni TaxID=2493646 RepID=A0AAE0RVJ1_9BIVA|nr:hypothetical protein CHS0354_003557 [Potamilus streckersoni]
MMEFSTLLSLLVVLAAVCTVRLAVADTQEEQIAKVLKTVYELEKLVLNQNEKLKYMEALEKPLFNAERRLVVIENLNAQTGKAGEMCARELNELKKRLVNLEGLWHYFAEADRQPTDDKETNTKKYKYDFSNGVAETHQHKDDVNKTHELLLRKLYINIPHNFEEDVNSQERLQIDTHEWKSQQMNGNRTKQRIVAGHVAFSAYLSKNLSGLSPNQTITFDRLDYNEGGSFDTTTSIFSCPTSGTYFFTASILSYQGNYVETAIVLNGEEQAIVYAGNPPSSPKYDQGSNSAIVHCDVGQKVWVMLRENYGNAVYGSRYSKFSGYMLW